MNDRNASAPFMFTLVSSLATAGISLVLVFAVIPVSLSVGRAGMDHGSVASTFI